MSLALAIKDRLADKVRCPSLLQVTAGASREAAEAMTLNKAVSVLVCPLSETAAPVREAAFKVSQRVEETIGVVLALVYPGGFEQFGQATDEIKAALRGWLPSDDAGQVEYAGGNVLEYRPAKDGGRWLHLLRFRAARHESYEAQS